MTNEKVIILIEAKTQPQRRAEQVEAARQYLRLVRVEPAVEGVLPDRAEGRPQYVYFYAVYRSQAAQDFHLQQDFTKKFLAMLESAQAGERVRTNLVELAPEAQGHSDEAWNPGTLGTACHRAEEVAAECGPTASDRL